MPIRRRLRRIIRNLNLAAHLSIHTADAIITSTRRIWRERRRRPVTVRHDLVKMIRYYVSCAIDARDCFPVDGDFQGRVPSRLPRQVRRHRRDLADRRRRYVTVLLNALGDTPDAVQTSLTRHWQIDGGGERPYGLVEDYLASRLVHRDQHALFNGITVYPWVCEVGGTWIATPRAIRAYLPRARTHERPLDTVGMRQPRRGVRVLPDRGRWLLATAPNR